MLYEYYNHYLEIFSSTTIFILIKLDIMHIEVKKNQDSSKMHEI